MVIINEGTDIGQTFTVGTSLVELSAEKGTSYRTELIITNTSTLNQKISLGIGTNAVDGVGIVLGAGSSYIASIDSRYSPTNKRITAIASAAGGSVAIYERAVSR